MTKHVTQYLLEAAADKLPSEYPFVPELPELPKGPTGKILKRALRN